MNVKPLCEVIAPPLEGTFRVFQHDYPFAYSGWHFHPEYEIHCICKSSGLCYVGTYSGPFDVGQLVLTGPSLPHMWVTDETVGGDLGEDGLIRGRDLVLQFSAKFAERCIEQFSDCSLLRLLTEHARAGVMFSPAVAHQGMRQMLSLLGRAGMDRLGGLFELLAVLAADREAALLSVIPPRSAAGQPKRFNGILEFIAENYNDHSLNCSRLAAMEKMTPAAFSRFFERHFNCNCNEYINRLRVYRACQLLIETDAQVTMIGYDVGYDTTSTFNRNFIRFMGTSPSEFRIKRRMPQERDATVQRLGVG